VYDAETQRVSSRVQPQAPPFDATAAALSLKTLLRTTELAPQSERFGAAPPARLRWPGLLRLEVGGGGRVFATNVAEPWLLLGAAVWPGRDWGRWGVSVCGGVTTGAGVSTASLSGVLREVALSAALHRWVALGDAIALVPFAGASARLTRLDATVTGASAPVAVTRLDPSLDAGVALPLLLLAPLDIGPYAGASYLVRYQRYLVGGVTAFEAWPVSIEIGLRATTTVF
jgi:hypothetical protein